MPESKGQDLFSEDEIEQVQARCERQLRLAGAMAARAGLPPQLPSGLQVPDFPPEPNFHQTWVAIPKRFAVESIRHLPDGQGVIAGITRLLTTKAGQALLERLKDVLFNGKHDPQVFIDLIAYMGAAPPGYGSRIFGAIAEAQGIRGVAALTGVAFSTKPGGKPKWFSGLKKSKGIGVEATTSLLFGYRVEEPENLTGQFYGYHAGIDIELSIGTNFYFDTSDDLNFQGFLTSVGFGIGLGTAVFWGWEMVIPDPG
jgi:hypothetical protein